MNVDYRKRCVVSNGQFDRVYYGVTAQEYVQCAPAGVGVTVGNLPRHYPPLEAGEQYRRGKLPGSPETRVQCFFNQRIV